MNFARIALAALGAFVAYFVLGASVLPPCRGLRISSSNTPRCTGPKKE
jgi:hypothetical protein